MREEWGCCALILAGGRSLRMGREKALITADGETLLERAARFWKSAGLAERILVAVGTTEHLQRLGSLPEETEPVVDIFEDCGPMVGILSAFRQTGAEILCVSAVDMPCLKREAAELLLKRMKDDRGRREEFSSEEQRRASGGKLHAGRRPEAAVYINDGRPEPLFGVYRRSIAEAAERLLRSGRRKMSDLLEEAETIYCPVPASMREIFRNINTPEDLQQLEDCSRRK